MTTPIEVLNKRGLDFLVGDVRDSLRTFDAGSFQSIITSPPYWALRKYEVDDSVWGGKAECSHHWGERGTYRQRVRVVHAAEGQLSLLGGDK